MLLLLLSWLLIVLICVRILLLLLVDSAVELCIGLLLSLVDLFVEAALVTCVMRGGYNLLASTIVSAVFISL